jgi:2-polyprenyl-3-methyl-5-hydroxy-6-metoxy-1,4-benzoquinol methylase
VIHRYIKIEDKILMIGCGNSKLSESMYDVGLKNIINIDLSEVVINQMNQKNRHRTGMKFLKMDMLMRGV